MEKIKRIRFLAMLLCVVMTLNAVPLTANAVGEDSLNEDPITQQAPTPIPDEAATTVPNEGGWEGRIPITPSLDVGETELIPPTSSDAQIQSNTDLPLAQGVYRMKHLASGLYLDVKDGNVTPGSVLQLWDGTGYENNRNMLFKVTWIGTLHLGADRTLYHYSIRPMVNSGTALSWGGANSSGYPVIIDTAAIYDDSEDFGRNNTWMFENNGSYYNVRFGDDVTYGYLSAPSGATNGSPVYTESSALTTSRWVLEPYTGEVLEGAGFYAYTERLITGKSFQFQGYMYSSRLGVNGPVTYGVTNTEGGTTDKARITSSTGFLVAEKSGMVTVRVSFSGAQWDWVRRLEIHKSMEGVYSFRNVAYNRYMQPDNGTNPEQATFFETHNYNGAVSQKWELEYVEDCYYKIKNIASGKYLTAQGENQNVTQGEYVGGDTQQWYISALGERKYKIKSRSNLQLNLASNWSLFGGGNVTLKASQSNNSDAWFFLFGASLIGFEDVDGYPRDRFISYASYMLTEYCPYHGSCFDQYSSYYTKNEIRNIMSSSKMVAFHTHGDKTSFRIQPNLTYEMQDISGTYMGELNLVVFLTCFSAQDYNPANVENGTPGNLIEACVDQGATCAMGFRDYVHPQYCNTWLSNILYTMATQNCTFEEAIGYLDDEDIDDYNWGDESTHSDLSEVAEVAGNGTVTIFSIFS